MKYGIDNPNYKHGLRFTREYKLWSHIKTRCYNEKCKAYNDYGGRGIKMYIHWIDNPEFFIDYIKSLDDYGKENYSLDRIDNDDDYTIGNLRWTSKIEQAINRRKRKNNISGYTGVSFSKYNYRCRITIDKETITIGYYDTPEQAVKARNEYILKNNLPHKIQ